jgi:RNA polymerase sigma-70 factor (ECF subfamily)
VRSGDARGAEELLRRSEPVIRTEVRCQLRDARLRRACDSMDICQSVLGSFFVRAGLGQYDLDNPTEVVMLLVGMARNKLAEWVRKEHRQRRDNRRVAADGAAQLEGVATDSPSPSDVAAGRELLDRFRRGLDDEERELAELRSQGLSWADIAAKLGGTAQARRMQLARAVERVARELGLDDDAS